ncbi:DUF1806 family protein [Alicyclobacillus dauci]|uniref:YojF family protein n=1 Tax=Alicyclobacillus dauci TaxID=1475485 RepID=A0ABY6Z0J3_9BACL|nr:DUF1806 family protein [Alicyclobacillus dauci]WAH35864.1 YojF family protein [Alicyclobacillus dauci]
MRELTIDEAKQWLQTRIGRTVYLHMESNPEGYIRNIPVHLRAVHIRGEGPYRVYVEWDNPQGILQVNDITDVYEDEAVLVFTAYDTQTRISHNLEISVQPLSM